MAIAKKLIHFKKWTDFSSKKLSANEQNTQYTLGVDGVLTTGAPDVLYQSICWIKDVKRMWTHGTLYDCSGGSGTDLSQYVTDEELSNAISEFVTLEDLAAVATSGSYNDLHDKPTIPSAVTESTVSGWGFTKNTGTYSKPSEGIPKSDLAANVQSALTAAESYKGTVIGVKANNATKMPADGIVDLGVVGTYSKPSTGIPKSDLNPSVQTSLGKADTAVQPSDIKDEVYIADFTMDELRQGVYDGVNVNCQVQSLINAMNANKVILVREDTDSAYKGVRVLNGYAEDLLYFSIFDINGGIIYCDGADYINNDSFIQGSSLYRRSFDDKQDTLVSGENIKTINGESIVGSGDITIEQGAKGDKGDTGVGIQSVTQTTTSNADGGSNVWSMVLTDGTRSPFTVKNGSKGSPGATGADGATFTPSVDSAGNLSWSNNKGLTNPPTVNIKGPKGDAVEGAATEEYVNNAIANAITNAINASY